MIVLGLILPKAPRKTSKKTSSDNNHPQAEIIQGVTALEKEHIEHAKQMQIKKEAWSMFDVAINCQKQSIVC